MGYEYRHGERAVRRGLRADTMIALVVITVLAAAGMYLYFSVNSTSIAVNDLQNRPQVLQATSNANETVIEEVNFRLRLPGNWVAAEPDYQSQRGGAKTTQFHYKTVGAGLEGRLMDVFVDTIPEDENVSKLIKVTNNGDSLLPGDISPQCRTFTSFERYGEITRAKWLDLEFDCNTSQYMNTVGISDGNFEDGVELVGPDGIKHTYMLIYTDHSQRQTNTLLEQIIRDFEPL